MPDDIRDTIQPIKRLVEVYACPGCHMAQLFGSAEDRYRAAQRCCAPRECPTCGKGIPKHHVCCRSCADAEQAIKEQARWERAPRVDVATLDNYMICADIDSFYSDLQEFLEDCADQSIAPADRRPYIALWRTAPVPSLIDSIGEDLPEEADVDADMAELEAYLAAEFEKRKIGAFFAVNQVPILPKTCSNCHAESDACYCAEDAELMPT